MSRRRLALLTLVTVVGLVSVGCSKATTHGLSSEKRADLLDVCIATGDFDDCDALIDQIADLVDDNRCPDLLAEGVFGNVLLNPDDQPSLDGMAIAPGTDC